MASAAGAERGLARYACHESRSRGRRFPEPPPPGYRGEFQRDRDRIVHSTAFRRLVYKTQVFVNHEGDLYRTRLTHSLEVAQIARSVCRALSLNESLCEAICLAHDLGHTPFGHAGQDALNECLRDHGGFEHNLQSLRVVDELEERYAEFPGLNLTFECREGILKHCSAKNAATLGDVGEPCTGDARPCERDHHAAPHRAEERGDPLRGVGGAQQDDVAGADPQRGEGRCHIGGALAQVRHGPRDVVGHDGAQPGATFP